MIRFFFIIDNCILKRNAIQKYLVNKCDYQNTLSTRHTIQVKLAAGFRIIYILYN